MRNLLLVGALLGVTGSTLAQEQPPLTINGEQTEGVVQSDLKKSPLPKSYEEEGEGDCEGKCAKECEELIEALRKELRGEFAALRNELRGEIQAPCRRVDKIGKTAIPALQKQADDLGTLVTKQVQPDVANLKEVVADLKKLVDKGLVPDLANVK